MRRWIVALAAVGLLVFGVPSSDAGVDAPAEAMPLALDVSGYEDRTTTVTAATMTPAERATGIGPGSQLLIDFPEGRALCSANFLWQDGNRHFLGSAGHCFIEDPEAETATGKKLSRLQVRVCVSECTFGGYSALGGSLVDEAAGTEIFTGRVVDLGSVVYARQAKRDEDIGNDFGLVEVPAEHVDLLRPSMPVFGGPTTSGQIDFGDQVCHYGSGTVVAETFLTMGRTGTGTYTEANEGWWEAAATARPGDSGSAVQVCSASGGGVTGVEAAGILTHGLVGAGTVAWGTTVPRAIEMAREAGLSICLVLADHTCGGGGSTEGGTAAGEPSNASPTADFTVSCTSTSCAFDGGSSSDPDGTITSYTWDFGDGSSGSGSSVSHTYSPNPRARKANYNVTLTVVDDDGAAGSTTRKVTCTDDGSGHRCG